MSRNCAFYVEVAMRSVQGGGERLYCKRDRRRRGSGSANVGLAAGEEGEESTVVKLNVLQIYALTITIHPGKLVKYMWLDGQKLDLKSVPHRFSEDNIVRYTTQWTTTGYEATKRSQRKKMNIEIEFTTGEFLKSQMLVKFYPAHERVQSRVGRLFSILSLLCHAPEGTFVNIHKKEYL